MKYTISQITKLLISDLEDHDSIHVYLENFNLGQGKITITCCDESWTNYWGAMGERTIEQFFSTCSIDYLIRKLSPIGMTIYDEEQMEIHLKNKIINMRKECDLSKEKARMLWDEIQWIDFQYNLLSIRIDVLEEILGDDWYHNLPLKPNPDYVYLYVIIKIIQEALKEINKEMK